MRTYQLVESPFLWHANDLGFGGGGDHLRVEIVKIRADRRVYIDDPGVREKEANVIDVGSFTAVLGPDKKTVEIGPEFSVTVVLRAPGFNRIARSSFTVKPPYSVEVLKLLADGADNEVSVDVDVDDIDDPDSSISRLLSTNPDALAAVRKFAKIASLSMRRIDAKERRLTLAHKPDVDNATAFEVIADVATKVGGSLASHRAAAHYEALGSTTAHITTRARDGGFARDIDVHLVFETEEQYDAFIRGATRRGLLIEFDR